MKKPFYTIMNCTPAYKLIWSVTLFWREEIKHEGWLSKLRESTEPEGVRILDYYRSSHSVSQFLVSTKPIVSPEAIIRSIKGRLQYIIREASPKAFQRNYSIKSVGAPKKDAVEQYLESQLTHHPFADERVTRRLANYQIVNSSVDLSRSRRSSYGEYCCNLHIVLVNNDRWREIDDGLISTLRGMIFRAAEKKGHLISRAGILADHIHIAAGSGIRESPGEVAVGYMNNLAYAAGMKPVFMSNYYVGTFGKYDLGAIREKLQSAAVNRRPAGTSPAAAELA